MKFHETEATESRLLETRIIRALESAPAVAIDDDFARRVAGMMPIGTRLTRDEASPKSSVGSSISWIAAALLLIAMLVLTHFAGAGTHSRQWIQVGLALEFTVLATGLSLHQQRES